MVGVQRDIDGVTLGGAMDMLRNRDCAQGRILERSSRGKCTAAGGDLNDAVSLALGEPAQNRIRSGEGSDVYGWQRETSGARALEHGAVGFVIGNGHVPIFLYATISRPSDLGPTLPWLSVRGNL